MNTSPIVALLLWALLLPATTLAADGNDTTGMPVGPAWSSARTGAGNVASTPLPDAASPVRSFGDHRPGPGAMGQGPHGWQYRCDLPYGAGYEARQRGRGWGHGRGR